MLYNVLGQLGYYRKLIKTAKTFFKKHKPDLVIVCDSPAFNFHIARAAKKLRIPVLFYVAPQLWAWAPWRIGKLRRCCDRLACILPFEEEWFAQRGVKAEFAGNPLLDNLPGPISSNIKEYRTYEPKHAKIALLAGSRNAEIRTLWPAMQEAAKGIKERYSRAEFVAVAADSEKLKMLKSLETGCLEVKYRLGGLMEAAMECDFALVASGSATVQVAAAGCPMIVMYQSNKALWHLLGRWLVRLKYLSLVNILAGEEVTPEFMPYFSSVEPIVRKSLEILGDRAVLARMSKELVSVAEPMAKGSASENVGKIVMEMIENK
jgi:lipid-A-disaccharide synthase